MRIGLVVPGGVDPSAEYRVIPVLLALISRLAARHEVRVFALRQQARPGHWRLLGADVDNIGSPRPRVRAIQALRAAHRAAPFDIIQSIWSADPGLVAVTAGRLLGVPALVHVAGGELAAVPDIDYGGGLSWRGRLREALVLRAAAHVSAASAPMVRALAQIGVRADRLPLGIDVDQHPPRAPRRRVPGSTARLIHVASLNRVKDQTTLLQALSVLRGAGMAFHLDLVGEDVLDGRIQRLAVDLGLADRVTFHGFLPQRPLRVLLERADLMLVSSRHEAGPVVVLEAAVAGVPTVGTDVGLLSEWAPRAARVVPVADPRALAGAVLELLGDENGRLELARAAQGRALAEDAGFTARAFEALYERLRPRA
ncbi:MAG: glycosyltransferase family 4 protein [Proteobacteria bacterium]|nr:glycosyltransferase family 4 protein [Pseudomonadota bacterium]